MPGCRAGAAGSSGNETARGRPLGAGDPWGRALARQPAGGDRKRGGGCRQVDPVGSLDRAPPLEPRWDTDGSGRYRH